MTVQPARARCTACTKTQVLLPAELHVRRADTTEVIGNALTHKANGLGFRRIAVRIERPESTVRRWLRRVPPDHLHWLSAQANRRLISIAVEVFNSIRYSGDPLHHALTVLAATALHDKQRFGFSDPPRALVGTVPPRGSACTYRPPRVQEAAAAPRLTMMPKSKAACSPERKAETINVEKKLCPSSVDCWAAVRCESVVAPSRCCIGL